MMAIRLFLEVLLFTVTLPFKVLCLIGGVGYIIYCAIKGTFTVREGLKTFFGVALQTLKYELYWVKTGDLEGAYKMLKD